MTFLEWSCKGFPPFRSNRYRFDSITEVNHWHYLNMTTCTCLNTDVQCFLYNFALITMANYNFVRIRSGISTLDFPCVGRVSVQTERLKWNRFKLRAVGPEAVFSFLQIMALKKYSPISQTKKDKAVTFHKSVGTLHADHQRPPVKHRGNQSANHWKRRWVDVLSNSGPVILTDISHISINSVLNLYSAIGKNTGGRICQILAVADAFTALV